MTVTRLAVSPDGRWLAVAGASPQAMPAPGGGTISISQPDKTVHVLDLTARSEVYQLESGNSGSYGAALLFTPDGRFLLTSAGGPNGQFVRQWDLATGKELRRFGGPETPIVTAALSPDERTILTRGPEGLTLWDTSTGEVIHQLNVKEGIEKAEAESIKTKLVDAGATVDVV